MLRTRINVVRRSIKLNHIFSLNYGQVARRHGIQNSYAQQFYKMKKYKAFEGPPLF